MRRLRIREKNWGSRVLLSRWTTVSGPVFGPCPIRVCEVVNDFGVSCSPLACVWIVHNHGLPVFAVVCVAWLPCGTVTLTSRGETCPNDLATKRQVGHHLLPATHSGSPSGTVQPRPQTCLDPLRPLRLTWAHMPCQRAAPHPPLQPAPDPRTRLSVSIRPWLSLWQRR